MAETQNTNIEKTPWNLNYDEQITSKLKEILWSNFSILEDEFDSLDTISSLDDEKKKILLNILQSKPEVWFEIFDNRPINEAKILRIIEINHIEENTIEDKTAQTETEIKQIGGTENKDRVKKEQEAELFKKTEDLKKELNLQENPNYEKYQKQAQEELLKSTPWLQKDPNFQSYVDTYILLQHQNEFLAWRPELKDKFSELTKWASTMEAFRNIKIEKYVERNFWDTPTLKRDVDKIKAWFISNWEQLQINGREFRLWDQVQVLDKSWEVKRRIESNWYSLSSDLPFEGFTKIDFEKFKIEQEREKALWDYKTTYDKAWMLKSDILKIDKEIGRLDSSSENSQLELETLQAERQQLVDQFEKETTKLLNLEQVIKGLDNEVERLERTKVEQKSSYRERLNENDEKIRQVLEFLNTIWITNIPQQDLETILSIVNSKYLSKSWFSKPFSLNNLFEKPAWDEFRYHKEFITFFNKLLWLEWAEALKVENVWKYVNGSDKSFTDNNFSQKVRDTLYTWWILNTSLLETRFWEWSDKK